MMPPHIDLTGQRFYNFLVIKRVYNKNGSKRTFWECVCSNCKRLSIVRGDRLKDGSAKCSCSYVYKNFRHRGYITTSMKEEIILRYEEGESSIELERKMNISSDSVLRVLKDAGIKVRDAVRNVPVNHRYFSKITTEDRAYWLGFIAADGNIHKDYIAIMLKASDYTHLEKFRRCIESNHKISLETEKYDRCAIKFKSRKMAEDLFMLGLTPKKSLSLAVNMKKIPLELQRHFWRGVIDGDGYISKDGRPTIGFCGTFDMLSKFKKHIGSKNKISKDGNIYKMYLSGKLAVEATRHLYSGCNVYLDRKHKLAKMIYAALI